MQQQFMVVARGIHHHDITYKGLPPHWVRHHTLFRAVVVGRRGEKWNTVIQSNFKDILIKTQL